MEISKIAYEQVTGDLKVVRKQTTKKEKKTT